MSSALLLAFDTLFALVQANVTADVGRELLNRDRHMADQADADQASCVPACLRETVGERQDRGSTRPQILTPDAGP